ncbi:MAG: transposase, partial [Verrucomicrobiota bacterium]
NLVAGMKWLQNTYTRRFNAAHKLWGHVFGGRYKAILCEDDTRRNRSGSEDYFLTLVDYVHLNPVRAGLVQMSQGKGLLDYRWSSLRQSYSVPANKRKPWSAVDKVLGLFGAKDDTASRRRYIQQLEKSVLSEAEEKAGVKLPKHQTLNSTLQRGWYWGSQKFQEKMLKKLKGTRSVVDRRYRSSNMEKQHGESRALKLITAYLKAAGLSRGQLKKETGSHPVKVFIAREIKTNTTVSLDWISKQLHMKSAANVSQQIRRINRKEIAEPSLSRIVA